MARLDRPFRIAGTPSLQGPSQAASAQDSAAMQRGFNNLSGAADQAVSYFKEIENDEASTDMSLDFSEYMNKVQDAGEFITADQARDLGYDGPNLIDEDLNDREDIALWEVLPDLAKSKYDELTKKYGNRLSGSGNRQRWQNRRKLQSEQYYSKLKDFQRQKFFEQKVEKHAKSIERAVNIGDFSLATELALSHPDPTAREQAVESVRYENEIADVHNAYQSGDVQSMADQIEILRSDEYEGTLTEVERTSNMNMLRGEIGRLSNQETIKRLQPYENMMGQYEMAMEMESPEAGAHLAKMYHYLQSNDMMDYAEKGYFAKQQARVAGMLRDKEDFGWLTSAWSMGNSGPIDQSDPKHTKVIDDYVDSEMKAAIETGDRQVIIGTAYANLDRAAKVGHVPQIFQEIMQDAALYSVNPEQVSMGAQMYGYLATNNPRLAQELPEDVRVFGQAVYTASQAGILDEKAIKEIRDTLRTINPDDLEKIDREFGKIANSEKDPLAHFLNRKADTSKWYIPFDGGFSPEISPQMEFKFKDLVRHHMRLNGGRPDQAQELAFQDWSNIYQPTKVNGRNQYMRNSIEQTFGVDTADVQRNFQSYLSEAIDDYSPDSNYEMYPDMVTPTTSVPTYAVYKVDDDGNTTLVTDDYGEILRYAPDIKAIKQVSKKQELANAKSKRMLYENPQHNYSLRGMGRGNTRPNQQENNDENQRESESRMRIIDDRSREIAADRSILEDLDSQ